MAQFDEVTGSQAAPSHIVDNYPVQSRVFRVDQDDGGTVQVTEVGVRGRHHTDDDRQCLQPDR